MNTDPEPNIFKNNFLINLKDGLINEKYFTQKYYFKKFLLYFFFSFCLIFLNYILSSKISNTDFIKDDSNNIIDHSNYVKEILINENYNGKFFILDDYIKIFLY